jgi:cysteine desulfurase/selenocysteine lyase
MPIEDCRDDFPLLAHLHYLDSASVSLTPVQVADAVREFDLQYRANVGRGVHRLARMATLRYEEAHRAVARFVRGEDGLAVATRNTTEAINMVARGLPGSAATGSSRPGPSTTRTSSPGSASATAAWR